MATIGILALQGGFDAHAKALSRLGHKTRLVRAPEALEGLEGLVFPGGESTTQLKLMDKLALGPGLEALRARHVPVLATCAGLILLARKVTGPEQASLGWLDVEVQRNAWGRQLDSFEATADEEDAPLVFIRAPRLKELGAEVQPLLRFQGEPILVRQGSIVGATYHPELTSDLRVHRWVFGEVSSNSR